MSEAECNYHIHDKELLAIIQAFHEWKTYTRGNPKPIRVLTDNKLEVFETTEFQDKDEGEIQKASNIEDEIQDIKRNLDEGRKEMNGIGLGLCQGKDGLLG